LLSTATDGDRVASARVFVSVYAGALLSQAYRRGAAFDAMPRREVASAVHQAAV
jgi:hypothetical protein